MFWIDSFTVLGNSGENSKWDPVLFGVLGLLVFSLYTNAIMDQRFVYLHVMVLAVTIATAQRTQ